MEKKKMNHIHMAYFGSELGCKLWNPNCFDKHKFGDKNLLNYCGNPNCPLKNTIKKTTENNEEVTKIIKEGKK